MLWDSDFAGAASIGCELPASSWMADQTRATAFFRPWNFFIGVWPGMPFQISTRRNCRSSERRSYVKNFGPNMIMVTKTNNDFAGGNNPEERRRKPLTINLARAIEERCPSVAFVSPYLWPSWSGIQLERTAEAAKSDRT